MTNQTVQQIMTPRPQCCYPSDSISIAARKMAEGNFGALPIVDPMTGRLAGIITDRDITCRVVANDRDPRHTLLRDEMSAEVTSIGPKGGIHECLKLMEERQIRRLPVVDERGAVLGIVAQADLARAAERERALEPELAALVERLSHAPDLLSAARAA